MIRAAARLHALWGIADPALLLIREWEGSCVVYHRPSGDTHCLDGMACLLFRRLRQGPASLLELMDVAAEALDELVEDEVYADSLMRILERLAHLGLAGQISREA